MKKIIVLLALITHAIAQGASMVSIQTFTGQEARKYFNDIARIRLTLFREYPYLYDGTIDHERGYLETYFQSPDATILLVFDGEEVVGFSNSIPLAQETDEVKAPFIEKGLALDEYLYIGEVMLYPAYRGQGILRKFLEFHEHKARNAGYPYTVFMTVERPDDHPSKPGDYQPLDPIWNHFGYRKLPGLYVHYTWTQVDTHSEEDNSLAIWQKELI